jgi:hypothetical protein
VDVGQFLLDPFDTVRAQLQAQRGVWVTGEGDDGLRGAVRVAGLPVVAGVGRLPGGPGRGGVVGQGAAALMQAAWVEEVGAEVPGFDDGDFDSQVGGLLSECLGEAFDGELRCVVDTPAR